MRAIDPNLQAHLNTGTTTLCYCWRLTLATGEKLGFTDHDVAVIFDGTAFEAQAGFTSTEIQSSLGLSVDNLEASGALSSNKLSDVRLNAGDFDHAQIEVWKVNWQDTTQRTLQRKGHLGEVTFGQGAFKAEVRGLAHLMNQKKGRLYHHGCDALLGDVRCGVNVSAFTATATISAVRESGFDVTGLSAFADDWFSRGTLRFLNVPNIGRKVDIKRHRSGSIVRVELWMSPKFTVAIGEQVSVVAGCDKQIETCRTKFSNAANFRGFPHMPGNDFVAAVAAKSDPHNNGLKR